MKNVKLLDCTLRDGGRIIDCAFSNREIKEIASRLANSKIDIVEIGFLRDGRKVKYCGNSTFFTKVEQISPFVDRTKKNLMYVAFVDYAMYDIDSLDCYDGCSIDGIRLGFTKKDYQSNKEDILRWANIIKQRGYKLFIQGVNSLNYTDLEMLELIELVNEIHPYSFGIVDTYGAMYMDDVDRLFALIDNNMRKDICINFHSHNNYQLSFALAQEIIRLSRAGTRRIIIDGTLGGMGKVAGNLNTELIADFLVRKMHYDYEFEDILDIIDDYINKYSLKYTWGYSIPALMAGIYKAHPNNIIYLTEKYRLDTKDIGQLLSMIDPVSRQNYNYDNIQKQYVEYVADKIDDYEVLTNVKKQIEGKEVLILVPGNTLITCKSRVYSYIEEKNPDMIISVNFVSDYPNATPFFGNAKRYSREKSKRKGKICWVSSNIKGRDQNDVVFNYHSLINRGYKYFENSTIMLFNLLRKLSPKKITIAGFDGFSENNSKNYIDDSYQKERNFVEFQELNTEICKMFDEITRTMYPGCEFEFITPSIFEKVITKNEI